MGDCLFAAGAELLLSRRRHLSITQQEAKTILWVQLLMPWCPLQKEARYLPLPMVRLQLWQVNGIAGAVDGTGTAASLSGPVGIAFDQAGNLYVTDYVIVGIPCINGHDQEGCARRSCNHFCW